MYSIGLITYALASALAFRLTVLPMSGRVVLALALPFVLRSVAMTFGDYGHHPASGIGRLGDLVFLDPLEMGEGVTRDGVIPHRFRIHHPAMIGMALAALLLHLLPVLPGGTRSK